jgi:secreted PhoX family phosphatase
MSYLVSRRRILQFLGVTAVGLLIEPLVSGMRVGRVPHAWADGDAQLPFTPVRLPHPLPIYQEHKSFLATGFGTGTVLPVPNNGDTTLASYTVIDDVVVPPEYERYVIARWGDRVFRNPDDYVGYNADYTAFVPILGYDDDDDRDKFRNNHSLTGRARRRGDDDDDDELQAEPSPSYGGRVRGNDDDDERGGERGYLWVNHEYVSYPASTLAPGVVAGLANSPSTDLAVLGFSFPKGSTPTAATLALRLAGLSAAERRQLYGEFYYNQGGSLLLISRRNHKDQWEVVKYHPRNRRIHGLSGLAINAGRSDAYQGVTSWGPSAHEQGDDDYLIGTGPAATDVFEGVNADGLGRKIIGTAFNCSGATTPWDTILTAEENYQGATAGASPTFMGVQEEVLPNGSQLGYLPNSGAVVASGTEFGLVGEKYGWLVEIDPDDPDFRPRKHTALGRFRHENITLRVERGENLVAYMGDDRRGGHIWKYVSHGKVQRPHGKRNSELLEDGTLYVARYNPDGTGQWIPVLLSTPANPLRPSEVSSVPFANGFTSGTLFNGRIRLPRRTGVAGQAINGGSFACERSTEAAAFTNFPAGYLNATLADFYPTQGAILCDAFHAGNLAGGTPAARPEDLEINPRNPREVFIAFTDGAPGGDGYPDSRIFQVAKLLGSVDATQQSGGLYKIREESHDSSGLTFHWEKLEQGGEAGAVGGSGFAAVDNLVFDDRRNVWGVTDMSTGLHNGFTDGIPNNPTIILHTATGDVSSLIGVFGNNWLFFIPTSGKNAGEVFPFAYGPTRCEMTGPTFVGNTLILAVQHPGEDCDFQLAPFTLNRNIEMLDLNGTLFTQNRTVTRSSNWPSNIEGNLAGPPRPSVIAIQRKDSPNRFT